MNRSNSQTKTLNLNRSTAFYALAFLAVSSFVLYLFFIGQTVFRLVSEKNTMALNRSLSSEVSDLEFQALSLDSNTSIDKAYVLGFVNATKTKYVSKTSELSLR
jgi:hypothetical protein